MSSISFNIIKWQLYFINMVLEKIFCLQLTKMEKKRPLLYILSSTGHRLVQTYYLNARIRWKKFNMSKKKIASTYNNVHRRMPAYEERTRRMPSVPLTYICAGIRWCHTLWCDSTLNSNISQLMLALNKRVVVQVLTVFLDSHCPHLLALMRWPDRPWLTVSKSACTGGSL